jgi:DNA-binding MarR family transcriptional regulator/GNAT superfamily N-acetyltransferase
MDAELIVQVRRFSRIVTQRVGALDESFLARDRSLGQARLLWEIGGAGCDVRLLRSRLHLDSGYLSRMLRALEADGLVDVRPSSVDGRVRTAHLTEAGLAERALLDRRSDEAAQCLLRPLTPGQRRRLVAAMTEVHRLLVAGNVLLTVTDPGDHRARSSVRAYFDELGRRFDDGFDPAASTSADDAELTPPAGLFLLATLHDDPVGCGALKFHDDGSVEIKRMWVSPAARGLGLGRRILAELERHARDRRARVLRLETNRALTEAIGMYRSAGYREVEAFNDESYAHHWFEKIVDP